MVRLAKSDQEGDRERGIAMFCESFWYPLYVFARRCGADHQPAQDQVQDFLVEMVKQDLLAKADSQRGSFRSYLLGVFRNFLKKDYRKSQTQKRGGGFHISSLEELTEERFAAQPKTELSPDIEFDRMWAAAILKHSVNRLREEYELAERSELFTFLEPLLTGSAADRLSNLEISERLGISVSGVGVSIHRMRRRFREILRDEVSGTVGDKDELEEELAYLRGLFSVGTQSISPAP